MKRISKLLALLLALVMVFCLAACGADNNEGNDKKDDKNVSSDVKQEESDAEKVLGEWICRFDLSDATGEELAETLGDNSIVPDTSLYMNMTLEFDDGEFTLVAEVDEDSFDDYMDDLCENMVDYMYDVAEEEGMSREEFEYGLEAEFGMTVEEYVEEQMDQAMEVFADEMTFEISLYYELDEDEGCIYIGMDEDELDSQEEAMTYSFSGKKLTISGFISEGEEIDDAFGLEAYGIELPWKFEKK